MNLISSCVLPPFISFKMIIFKKDLLFCRAPGFSSLSFLFLDPDFDGETRSFALTLISSAVFAMDLSSGQVTNGKSLKSQQIFNHWGCKGEGISPELKWKDVPKGRKSFAVTLFDPDAPTGSAWWHWVMINIPADTQKLPLNAGDEDGEVMPKGPQMQRNDFGFHGYGGACLPPKSAPHNDQITMYVLDVENLDVPLNGAGALAEYYIFQHRLAKAQLFALLFAFKMAFKK